MNFREVNNAIAELSDVSVLKLQNDLDADMKASSILKHINHAQASLTRFRTNFDIEDLKECASSSIYALEIFLRYPGENTEK